MKIEFGEIAPFYMNIQHTSNEGDSIVMFDQHVHPECEICINLSGDVSFMVEDTVYPIAPGSVIIARPFEAHHCIYHSTAVHDHFWILFSANGNERYFDLFFNRSKGHGNHIALSAADTARISHICRRLLHDPLDEFTKYRLFSEIIDIIRCGKQAPPAENRIRKEIADAVTEINRKIGQPLSVRELSAKANMSLRAFERNFRRDIGTTPGRYIKTRRLAMAKAYLAKGLSVSRVSEVCGYPDASSFVSEFRRFYGITPLKYRQTLSLP